MWEALAKDLQKLLHIAKRQCALSAALILSLACAQATAMRIDIAHTSAFAKSPFFKSPTPPPLSYPSPPPLSHPSTRSIRVAYLFTVREIASAPLYLVHLVFAHLRMKPSYHRTVGFLTAAVTNLHRVSPTRSGP